ncbi:Enoyl-CoA hydratase / 3-hydroxyacyl-CoA dehydrogenase / 3-hydroxybutyryl-CoA epimerase [hydrothermal vent metagenome]|uniref:enoyl-CoA hydratase n=1 Tax=hydrothermal vent metagenome TaxID=652676 RepID=A0A3B0XBB0_9ZZZZ
MSDTYWKVEHDKNNIAWLHFDTPDASANLLSQAAIKELDDIIKDFESNKPKAVIILSDKKDSFIFGADIKEFTTLENKEQALKFLQKGHALMNRLEALNCPTVSMVHGLCFGGGTELSLACDYIVASDHKKTKIGLPEIKLGIHPGYGGTARSIKRCGPLAAMNIMLTGRALTARAAKKINLIDEMVPLRQLKTAAEKYALSKPKYKQLPLLARLSSTPFLRPLIATQMRKKIATKAKKEHYPAPYSLIDLWLKYGDNKKQMLEQEAIAVAELATSNTARNLVRVFFLQENLKSQGKKVKFDAKNVHVIGGGIMGGDIASWCAIQGYSVTVQDQDPHRLAQTIKRAQYSFKKKFKRDRRAIRDANDRLMADHRGTGIQRADIVIEAIFEDVEAKRALYESIEPLMKTEAILATNTSSIKLEDLSSCLKNPGRLVGLHFFNPVALMPLVEIIRGKETDEEVVQQALAFGKNIGKLPLAVKSSPGFLVNRILMPYILEAVTMLDEGIAPEVIDKAATDYGMPMGPIELADTVGLDICKSVADILSAALGMPLPDNLKKLSDKKLGKKTGEGFYKYKNNKPVKNKNATYANPKQVQDRLVMRLINEAVACLHEGIVDKEDLIDAGVIFGTGFAPFRGGPLEYIKNEGVEKLGETITHLQEKFGDRFKKNEAWSQIG